MKSFIKLFTDARAISTPSIAIRTFDPLSTILAIQASLGDGVSDLTPLLSWDAIHGLRGLNKLGTTTAHDLAGATQMELGASVDMPIALGMLEYAKGDIIAFVHNPQLVWDSDKKIIQGIANLRNDYKANGNMLITLIGFGDTLPIELQQDTLILEHPLPTRDELAKIVTETYAYAATSDNKRYKACASGPTAEVLQKAVDALIGLPAFPAEQATAMCLDKVTGILDIAQLWTRKKDIVSQRKGLSYRAGGLTLKNLYGVESFKNYGVKLMSGKHRPTVIVRMDEIQRQFSGSDTESSGTKGTLLGEWLTWINDNNVFCTLNLGIAGSSKTHSIDCIAGEFGMPVVDYSIPQMEDSLVGNSAKYLHSANATLDAISGKNVWLIATANKLDGLPPELVSRFQAGGIFFFDVPDDEEKRGIMKLKIEEYGLEPNQPLPDMAGWTGRDIKNCALKAQKLESTLTEAGEYVVPLMTSHKEDMEKLRTAASGRFLSASKSGVYQYTEPAVKHTPTVKITEGRKFRTEGQ